ncbi:hypothetical protein LCGC14_2767720, partial [marine sediment metagenome]
EERKRKLRKMTSNAILEILPTGEIRFNRDKMKENRELVLSILEDIIDDPIEVERIKSFLNGANNIDVILGDRILCG